MNSLHDTSCFRDFLCRNFLWLACRHLGCSVSKFLHNFHTPNPPISPLNRSVSRRSSRCGDSEGREVGSGLISTHDTNDLSRYSHLLLRRWNTDLLFVQLPSCVMCLELCAVVGRMRTQCTCSLPERGTLGSRS